MDMALAQFINGAWRRGRNGEQITIVDPATEETLDVLASASIADTEEAIAAAAAAFRTWRATPAWTRADILHKCADVMVARTEEAARRITLEAGKPLAQSRREWQLSIDQFRWYAEEARRIHGRITESRAPGGRLEVHHEPVGVVAAFTAWNFPAVLIARKVAPALAAGCSIIVRPSRETPGTAAILVDCLRQAGVPAGVISLVVGPTSTTYDVLMKSPVVRKVSLTGSSQVGQQMLRDAAGTFKRATMELGGNAPVIVFDDANLEATLDICVPVKFANAGQVCVTGDRFYVHASIYGKFVDGFAARAKALKLGHGLDDTTQMGPLINARRIAAIDAIVADARKRGGRVVAGGERPSDKNKGFFYAPTVIADLPDDALALAEENFGPIAAITSFSTDEEVYARANATELGLSAYAFTRDPRRMRETVAQLEAGMVGINSFALAAAEAPFGGIKASGMGREGGGEGIHDYLNVKLAQMSV
ncbi:MAG: NAD-dependent succinate-semialdehyde dehydrogenase [Rhizobiales bacterium]|nr:NAD-dependent succinate-semialdehyde dehydrogenase [Hyphomicrobiales bacterium]